MKGSGRDGGSQTGTSRIARAARRTTWPVRRASSHRTSPPGSPGLSWTSRVGPSCHERGAPMTQADHDRRIDYIEFGATDIERTKRFYQQVFGWRFEDYGPDYTSFRDGRLSGGFTKDAPVRPANPLVVIYAARLEEVEAKLMQAGGKDVRQTYTFPGGRPFPLSDPPRKALALGADREAARAGARARRP